MHDELVVAAIEEQLDIKKRVVSTGAVRILKTVNEKEELIDEPLRTEMFEVHRVSVNRLVDGPLRSDTDARHPSSQF